MSLKLFLSPNPAKVVGSFLMVVIWYLLLYSLSGLCGSSPPCCEEAFPRIISMLPECECCFEPHDFAYQLLFIIIFPFAIAYLLISLMEAMITELSGPVKKKRKSK